MNICNKYYLIAMLIFATALNAVGQQGAQSNPKFKKTGPVDLPFGDSLLITHKFPREWEFSENRKNKDQKAFEKIDDYYIQLKRVKSISGPILKRVSRIAVDKDRTLNFYDQHFKGTYKYQLPDFGFYKVYYRSVEIPMPYYYQLEDRATSDQELFTCYGDLVFYNPQDKHALILNVYQSYSNKEPVVVMGRIFYIDKYRKIQLFETVSGESTSAIRLTHEVQLDENGKLLITRAGN